jgi:hypothetical protein
VHGHLKVHICRAGRTKCLCALCWRCCATDAQGVFSGSSRWSYDGLLQLSQPQLKVQVRRLLSPQPVRLPPGWLLLLLLHDSYASLPPTLVLT